MNTRHILAITAVTALLTAGGARAQGDDGEDIDTLDLTIQLMPEGATLPDAVTKVIELPEVAADAARENAADGLETPNEARENREAGLAIAAEAIEQAQLDRENAGRGPPEGVGPPDGAPEGLPDNLPSPPENLPGPPSVPAGN